MIGASALKRRRKELECFLLGIRVLGAEMRYAASPLYLCFQRAGESVKTEVGAVFLQTAEGIRESGNGEASFLAALDASREDLALTEGDLEKLRRFAMGLGTADLEHSLKTVRILEDQLESAVAEASEQEKKWCNVFRGGGWLVGFAAALIFI